LVLCHQRQDFQLKMHHKAFGGWTPLDILAGLREGDERERGKEGGSLWEWGREWRPHFSKQIHGTDSCSDNCYV